MGIGRNDNVTRMPDGTLQATAQFAFPEEKVILEVITKDDPMTPERARKIELYKQEGYDVVIFENDVFSSFEKFDEAMAELSKKLGQYNKEELDEYKEQRRQTFNMLFS